jgi:hypothetical protein
MAAPNDDSSQPPHGSDVTGSQQQDEGAIAQDIMKTVMEEQAYQDLNAKLSSLEEELARERKEKDEAISRKNELGAFLPVNGWSASSHRKSVRISRHQCAARRGQQESSELLCLYICHYSRI